MRGRAGRSHGRAGGAVCSPDAGKHLVGIGIAGAQPPTHDGLQAALQRDVSGGVAQMLRIHVDSAAGNHNSTTAPLPSWRLTL